MKKILSKSSSFNLFTLLAIFITIILITGGIAFSRKISKPQNEIYIKIKLSQGLWWAASYNPPLWLAKAINPGNVEKDLFDNDIATVLTRTYYPTDQTKFPNQYEVYVTLKLATKKDSGTNTYRYKRNTLAIGSPINIDLSSTTVSGSIMEISESPLVEKYITKKVTLYDQYGYYADSPTLYNNIKIGDEYFDGQDTAFKITGKHLGSRQVYLPNQFGKIVTSQLLLNQNIYVEAEIKVKDVDGSYFYGEEQRVTPGANLNIITNSQDLTRFTIVNVN